jgi:hypothetical protein
LNGFSDHLTLPIPDIEALAASLRGRQLPGGKYRIAPEDCRAVDALCAGTGSVTHPVFACVAALRGLGISIDQLCRLCDFELARGPMLGECQLELRRPLQAEIDYTTSVIIDDLVRSTSRVLGVFDRLQFTVALQDSGPGDAALVKLTWLFPRGGEF